MKPNRFTIPKKLLVVILLGLLGLPMFGQTEEQSKHPKLPELYKHHEAYNVAKQKGDYDTALTEGKKALEIGKEIFGEEDTITAGLYNNMGIAYDGKGEYDNAIDYHNKSLRIRLKLLGEEHPYVASSYNNLGSAYNSKGEYDKAIEYHTKSLQIRLKLHGENHVDTAISYNDLGVVYYSKGDYEKAIEYVEKSLSIRTKILGENHSDVLISYNNLGVVFKAKKDYERAIHFYEKASLIEQKLYGEKSKETIITQTKIAELWDKIGIKYVSSWSYEQIIEAFEKSLRIRLKIFGEENSETAYNYSALGRVYSSQGEFDKAIEYQNKSLLIRLKLFGEEHSETAESYDRLGLIYNHKGEYDKATEYHNKSLRIQLKILGEEHYETAESYDNLGSIYNKKGEYYKATEYHDKSLRIRLKILGEENLETARSYSNLGSVYDNKGEYDKAIEYHNKSLGIRLKISGENHKTAENYNDLGVAYNSKGEYDKAIEYHSKCLKIFLKIFGEQHYTTATSYINLGSVYANKNDYSRAIEYYSKSLPIFLKILGNNHPATAVSYGALGNAYYSLKDYNKALDYHQKAISILEKSGDRFGHINSYLNLRDVYKAQKNTEMKIFVLKEAMELVLKYRTEMGKDKEYFTQKFYSVFEELLDVYMQSEQFDRALEISEKMRGLSLSENFNLKYALTNGGAPVDKAEKMLGLRKELEGLYSQRLVALQKLDEVGRQISNRLWNEISTRENELNAIDKELMQKPIYARLRKLNSPTITDLQTDARKVGKTFLEYNLIHKDGKEELHVSVITPDLFRHLNLGKDTDLTRKVNNLRKIISEYPNSRKFILLKNKEGKEILCTYSECKGFEKGREYFVQELDLKDSFKEDNKKKYIQKLVGTQERKIDVEEANRIMDSLLKELYAIIIKPIEKAGLLKSKSIVISPDSTLFTVPFSALKNADGKYAIEEYEISLIHSASIWERLVRKEALKFTKPFFAMGNSVYGIGHDDTRGVKGKRGLRSMEKDLRSLTDMSDIDTMRMNNLPGSLEEIKEISRMAYEKEIESEHIFLGIRANKEELYKKFEKPTDTYRSVHFSVHGLFFMDSPEMNSLAFTSRERAAKFREEDLKEYEKKNGEIKKDGFFKLGETIELGIKTDLLVMSACETSLGTEKAGEGMVGLPQGFLMGGANNVLATLWSVDDKGTMNFMKEFYSPYFKKNLSPTRALRSAQNILSAKDSKGDKYKDPFYWSPFVVYGK